MDYSGQGSHLGEHGQQQHAYDLSSHQRPRTQQHRAPIHHQGTSAAGLHAASDSHQNSPLLQNPVMAQHHTQHSPQMVMDPSQLGHHRMGPSQFGPPGQVVGSMYQAMGTPPQPTHQQHPGSRLKRPRPSDLDLSVSDLHSLDQSDLSSMQQSSLGAAYAQTAIAAVSHPSTHHHHHHHLPDSEPPSKSMRRDDMGGGAPSVVGQAGMPAPASRPRGPKLKFTSEDDQLLIELKENKNLTWKQIADFFPGRSSGTLQVRYCTKLKAKTTNWTEETDQKLTMALQDYENEKWRIVANKVGTGFTPAACRDRAEQLQSGDPSLFAHTLPQSLSPAELSIAESGEVIYQQQLQ